MPDGIARMRFWEKRMTFKEKRPRQGICHCEPVTDVTGVALSKDSLRSQSVIQAFPGGEGVSRVSRKRETDEGKNATVFRGTS